MNDDLRTEPSAHVFEEMRQNAIKTAEGLEHLAQVLESESGLELVCSKLRERADKLRNDRFTFLVLGEFKRGKSTLINAMLGTDFLPRKAAPATAILTAIRYGETPSVRVLFTDGEVKELTPEDFKERYSLKVADGLPDGGMESAYYEAMGKDRFNNIDMAEVNYPYELCRFGIELVDSPGLAEHEARERRTLEYLRHADAIIMVLYATHFLGKREREYIQDRITPLGLRRNLFFLINGWNLLEDGLLDRNDQEERRRCFAEQNQLIEQKLNPLCHIEGKDLSTQRIFMINALGALQQRCMGTPNPAVLEETQVPAFERSLAFFLRDDRLKARQHVDRNIVAGVAKTVIDHRRTHEQNLDKSLDELKSKYEALQPKLEEMGRVAKHIEHLLSSMASEAAEELIHSFDAHIQARVREPLPEAVQNFDLGRSRTQSLFLMFEPLLDYLRPEGKKFRDELTAHLQPQIVHYLRPRIIEWIQTVESTYLPTVAQRVESELKAEAEVYTSILGQVGESIGDHLKGGNIEEILKKWLQDSGDPRTPMVGVGIDLAPVMAGVVVDLGSELTLHMSAHLFPGVGLIVSVFMLMLRRYNMINKIRSQIHEEMNKELDKFVLAQHQAIRNALKIGFKRLDEAIVGKIREQIAQIDGDMRSLIELKERGEADATARRKELAEFQAKVDNEVEEIMALLPA